MTVKIGDSGEKVKEVQELLTKHGINVSVDGDFGPKTETAVKSFQQSRGLAIDGIVGLITMAHLRITGEKVNAKPSESKFHQDIISAMNKMGATIHQKDYHLNLIGLRKIPGSPNAFDDLLVSFYQKNGVTVLHEWPITADPGVYWLQHPERVDGTAILLPGYYPNCWKLGLHKGQYEALIQSNSATFKVWRDANRNRNIDYTGTIYDNVTGLNCHRAGKASVQVEKWSAACQVHAKEANFYEMMSLVHKQIDAGKETFDYTLLEWDGANIL